MEQQRKMAQPNHRLILRNDIVDIAANKLGIPKSLLKDVMRSMNEVANIAVSEFKNFYVSDFVKFRINKKAYSSYIKKHSQV